MAFIPPFPPFDSPIAETRLGNRVNSGWRAFFQWLYEKASSFGTGDVTAVGTLTNHAVILGSGTTDVHAIASLGSAGQVLTSNGAASDPSFQAAAGDVTHTGTLPANQLIYGNGGADIKAVAATNGQIPIGKTSDGTALLSTLTAGTGITITNAANAITIAAAVSADYVVMSDGAVPPSPVNDGGGNFIYVTYSP